MFATIAWVVFVYNAQWASYVAADVRKSMCSLGVAIFRVMPVYEKSPLSSYYATYFFQN